MNTKSLPALYQIETIGLSGKGLPSHPDNRHDRSRSMADRNAQRPRAAAGGVQRAPDFLVQLMVQGDPDLRKALGSRHLAARRENAYGQALAARPSQARGLIGTLTRV